MWIRVLITGAALALVLYAQCFFDFKDAIPQPQAASQGETQLP